MNNTRLEHDFIGEREIPADVYYGVQTLRALENFNITGQRISQEPFFVQALAYVKKGAAMANRDLGVLDPTIAEYIIKACDQLIAGKYLDQFPSDMIQEAPISTNKSKKVENLNIILFLKIIE